MSFLPISENNINDALYGIGDPAKFNAKKRFVRRAGYKKENDFNNSESGNNGSILTMVIIIIISALIFITFVSIFDVFRSSIDNYYGKKALEDPESNNTKIDIKRTLIANEYSLVANVLFSILCILLLLLLAPILAFILIKKT